MNERVNNTNNEEKPKISGTARAIAVAILSPVILAISLVASVFFMAVMPFFVTFFVFKAAIKGKCEECGKKKKNDNDDNNDDCGCDKEDGNENLHVVKNKDN